MAKYTISILDMVTQYAEGRDITDMSVLLDIAKNNIFGAELNVISDEYRDRFALGFVLEFLYDEIGLPTIPGWKLALKHKVYDNAEFIDWIFENVDKQVFSNYKVHKIVTNTSGNESGTQSGKVDTKANGTTNTTRDLETANETTTNNTETLDTSHTKSGTETTHEGGDVTTKTDNTNTRTQSGDVVTTNNLTDSTTYGKVTDTTSTTTEGGTVAHDHDTTETVELSDKKTGTNTDTFNKTNTDESIVTNDLTDVTTINEHGEGGSTTEHTGTQDVRLVGKTWHEGENVIEHTSGGKDSTDNTTTYGQTIDSDNHGTISDSADRDISVTNTGSVTHETSGSSSQTSRSTAGNSDTPQSGLADVQNLRYLTNATYSTTSGDGSTDGTDTRTDDTEQRTKGNSGNVRTLNDGNKTKHGGKDIVNNTTTYGKTVTDTETPGVIDNKDDKTTTTNNLTDETTNHNDVEKSDTTTHTGRVTTSDSKTEGGTVEHGMNETTEHTGTTKHTGSDTDTYDKTDATTSKVSESGTDTATHTGTSTVNTTDSVTTTDDGTVKEDFNKDNTVTYDTTDSDTGTVNNSGTGNSTTTETGTVGTTTDTTGSTTSTGESAKDYTSKVEVEDINYEWSYEILMKSNGLLKKVWRLFDDIFLGLL